MKKAAWNRRFEFRKRSQLFICAHNEKLSVAAMRINDPPLRSRNACCSRPQPQVLLRFLKGERARHAPGTDGRSPARDCPPAVNRCRRVFKTARERADCIVTGA